MSMARKMGSHHKARIFWKKKKRLIGCLIDRICFVCMVYACMYVYLQVHLLVQYVILCHPLIYFALSKPHLFFKLLIISFMHICFDEVHPHSFPSSISPSLLYILFTSQPHVLFFLNPLSPLSATCMCMCMYRTMCWHMGSPFGAISLLPR